jgi:hypothetical protein
MMNVPTRAMQHPFSGRRPDGPVPCSGRRYDGLVLPRAVPAAAKRLAPLFAAIVFLWPAVAEAADPSVWPQTPYQVQVYVAAAPAPVLTPRLVAALQADLAARIDGVIGSAWNTTVSPAPAALRGAMLRDIGQIEAAGFPIPSPEPDKVLLVAVTVVPDGLLVSARDFDVHTRTLGLVAARPVWQVGTLCNAALDATLAAFAPLARVERIVKEEAVLRLKAAKLPPRDKRLALVRAGDVFHPIIRYNNRQNKFDRAVPAQWSFCVVEKIVPEEARCRVQTGMRAEMVMKGRGRAELVALRVSSPTGPTTLRIESRAEPRIPLAGCDVYAYPPAQKDAVSLVGRTDRQGRVVVPPGGNSILRVLLVKSGSAQLAKLPVVPGMKPQLTAYPPNDEQRLNAEGYVGGRQDEVDDLVAARAILKRRVEAGIETKDFERASKLLDDMRHLRTGEQLSTQVAIEQEKLVSSDPAVQKKIDAMWDNVRKVINKHLDPAVIDELDRELRAAKLDAK